MKNTRRCPKCGCGAGDILRIGGPGGQYGTDVPVGPLSYVPVTRLVCAGCGYSEEWIELAHDIDRLRHKFPTLQQEEEPRKNEQSPSASVPTSLPPLPRCSQCEAPMIDFGHGLVCPRCPGYNREP